MLDLATHTSGLPRLPALHPANPDDPYADLTEAQLRDFLAQDTLTRAPGSQYEYSNLGMGLLALALSRHAGVAYETLLEQRILGPLGMHDTRITLTPELEARSATGHDESLEPTHAWHFEMLAGAGALHSTLPDLLKLVRAVLDTGHGPLARDLAFAIRTRRPTSATDSIGLAWHHLHVGTTDVVWHNGGTGGFRSWLAIDIAHQRATVLLANVGGNFPLDPIGLALLRGGDLPPPPVVLSAIALPPEALERFVGTYQLTPSFSIVITRAGDQLEAQATGQQKLPIFPSAPTTFFYKVVKAELLFQLDSSNRVTGVVLRQNGIGQVGRKVR